MKMMMGFLLLATDDLKITMLGVRIGDPRRIGRATTIGNENLIACGVSQHPHAVGTLFFGEGLRGFYIGAIK